MTAIGPWALAWGKLFGSSLFAWYGGLFCLLIFCVSSFAVPLEETQKMVKVLFVMNAAGFCIQTALFAFILTEFRKNRDTEKMNISSYSIVAVLLLGIIAVFARAAYHDYRHIDSYWYSIGLHRIDIMLYSSLFFCLWG